MAASPSCVASSVRAAALTGQEGSGTLVSSGLVIGKEHVTLIPAGHVDPLSMQLV